MVDCTSRYCGRSMNSSLVLGFNQNLPISQNPVLGLGKILRIPNNQRAGQTGKRIKNNIKACDKYPQAEKITCFLALYQFGLLGKREIKLKPNNSLLGNGK